MLEITDPMSRKTGVGGTPWFMDETGLTTRQVNYWRMGGVLCPVSDSMPGSGHRVTWDHAEVQIARLLLQMAEVQPVEMLFLAKVARNLRAHPDLDVIYVSPDGTVSAVPHTGWCLIR